MNLWVRSIFGVFVGFCGILLLSVSSSVAEVNPSQASQESLILSKIHQTNKMEIEVGKLARSRGGSAQVRAYGDRLVRDHRAADQKILAFAKGHEILLIEPKPTSSQESSQMREHETLKEKLSVLKGAAFDQTFLPMMETGHAQVIQTLSSTYSQLGAGDFKNLLGMLIPILKQHEQLALHLEQSRNPSG